MFRTFRSEGAPPLKETVSSLSNEDEGGRRATEEIVLRPRPLAQMKTIEDGRGGGKRANSAGKDLCAVDDSRDVVVPNL